SQRPRLALVGPDPYDRDPLAPVQLVEDRLQVGAVARGEHDDAKFTHRLIFAQMGSQGRSSLLPYAAISDERFSYASAGSGSAPRRAERRFQPAVIALARQRR